MLTNIVVHPGKAHLDDFLSVAFLLHHYNTNINVYRRNPTPEDLNSPSTAVIDQGGHHIPAVLNFDHHQFSPDAAPKCALSLVLCHLGLYDSALETNWMEYVETYDSKGPIAAANLVGCDREALKMVQSPIESAVLEMFSAIGPNEPVPMPEKELLFTIAKIHVDRWQKVSARIAALPKMLSLFNDGGGQVAALNLHPNEKPLLGLESYFKRAGLDPVLSVVASDREYGCWVICRRHGWENVIDLRELPGCQFAHSNGFLAVTCQMEFEDAVAIAREGLADAWINIQNDATENVAITRAPEVPFFTDGPTAIPEFSSVDHAKWYVLQLVGDDYLVEKEPYLSKLLERAKVAAGSSSVSAKAFVQAEKIIRDDMRRQATAPPEPAENSKAANEAPTKPLADGLEDYGDGPEDYSAEGLHVPDVSEISADVRFSSQHEKTWHGQKRGGKPFFSGVSGVWNSETGPVAIVAQTKQILSLAWLAITGVKLNTDKIQNVEIHPSNK